jgi:hypothetical protein
VGHLGWRFEFFRKQNSNLVGYIVDIPNEDDLKDILLNSALVSTRLKKHGVLFETIEVLEAVTDRVKPEVTQLLKNFS